MKVTATAMVTTALYGAIGSFSGCLAGIIVTRFWVDLGVGGPVLGFIFGTLIGAVAGFISSTGIMSGVGGSKVAIGGREDEDRF